MARKPATQTKQTNQSTASNQERKIDLSKYDHLPTTSAKIRAMAADGFDKGEISRSGLKTKEGNPIRYQHVRNVLVTPVKSTPAEGSEGKAA